MLRNSHVIRTTPGSVLMATYGCVTASCFVSFRSSPQELDAAMVEFLMGKSLVTQRRDIVLGRHCAPCRESSSLFCSRFFRSFSSVLGIDDIL